MMPDLDDLRGDPDRVHEAAIELEGLRRHHMHGDEDCWRAACHPDNSFESVWNLIREMGGTISFSRDGVMLYMPKLARSFSGRNLSDVTRQLMEIADGNHRPRREPASAVPPRPDR